MKIAVKICILAAVSVMISVFSLFAYAEQTAEKPAEGVKTEESAEPQGEPQAEAASEKENELEIEEAAAAIQGDSAAEGGIEIVESEGNFIFSARSLNKMTWNEAQNYCKKLEFWGETWRLPNIDEIRELMRNCPATEPGGSCRVSDEGNCLAGNCSSPKNSCTCERMPKNRGHYSMFGDADYIGLWSGSTLSDDDKKAWGAVFYSGMIGSVSKESKLYVRCIARSDWSFAEKDEDKDEKKDEESDKKNESAFSALSKKDINKQFDRKMRDFSFCIYKGKQEDSDMKHGRVTIDYTVSPKGEVLYSGVLMSTFGNLTVENCVATKVREMKFPAPKRGATVFLSHSILLYLRKDE